MIVREAVPDDAEPLIAYVRHVTEEPDRMLLLGPGEFQVTPEQERSLLAEYAASDNSLYLIAEAEGQLIAALSCEGGRRRAARHAASFGMSVAPEWRNQGVGTALLERLVAWAEGAKVIRRLELEVFAHNAPARHLYRKYGFVEEGQRREAYFLNGRYVDGILMARLLPPA